MPLSLGNALRNANGALAEYIDRLWAGRSVAPASLSSTYMERLVSAARLASLLMQPRVRAPAITDLLRKEGRAFPRDFLSTDEGREARSAFNVLRRVVRELEEYGEQGGDLSPGFDGIIGAELSAVSFVRDYLQLAFDGPSITVFCAVVVRTQTGMARTGEAGFRDRLCETIGRNVTSIEADDSAVRIGMDECTIEIDLAAASTGPEKLLLHDLNGWLAVWA